MIRTLSLTGVLLAALSGHILQAATPRAPVNGFRAEFIAGLTDVEQKLTSLARAIPADQYNWRPAGDVRSISEVFMHVAGSNYFLATFLGRKPPGDIPEDIEKITEKTRVLRELAKSFDHLRAAAMAETESGLETRVKLFGTQTTHRGVFVTILNHVHEHLGQSIAYARMNGVVPPWSR